MLSRYTIRIASAFSTQEGCAWYFIMVEKWNAIIGLGVNDTYVLNYRKCGAFLGEGNWGVDKNRKYSKLKIVFLKNAYTCISLQIVRDSMYIPGMCLDILIFGKPPVQSGVSEIVTRCLKTSDSM